MSMCVVLAVGCGKDSSGPGDNAPPSANFSYSCADLACSFTDLSSDSDGSVAALTWAFGDDASSTSAAPSHAYAASGDFVVNLAVTDNDGAENSITKTVTVSAPANGAPSADFEVSCRSLDCTVVDRSTDADGTVVGWQWNFGDGQTSTAQNPPVHHYANSGLQHYTVSLTATDDAGLQSSRSADITVSPPARLSCNGVACSLILNQASRVSVKLTSRSCTARNNAFRITAPVSETLFSDGCYNPAVGTAFPLNGGNMFPAGTALDAEVLSGSLKLETSPALRVSGAYPTWTLSFDDGEDGTPPEPDFNDLVLTVTATP
ncbi:MAG: PKD domain-containing protein [Gemmatimonadales bacterium]|nr:PKD domain-containing protein [Gemmatimonadales bacterium]